LPALVEMAAPLGVGLGVLAQVAARGFMK